MTDTPDDDPIRAAFAAAEPVDAGPDPFPDGGPDYAPDYASPPDDGRGAPPPPADPALEEALKECAGYALNDHGNGQRFARHFGDDVIFVPRLGWFTWDGRRWEKDEDRLRVRAFAQRLGPLIEDESRYVETTAREAALLRETREIRATLRREADEDERTRLSTRLVAIDKLLEPRAKRIGGILKHAKSAGNSGSIDHMMQESTTSLSRPHDALDVEQLAVCTPEGVWRFAREDMSEEGGGAVARVERSDPDRGDLITKLTGANYLDPDSVEAAAPRFHAFLEEIQPDIEMRRFLQRWFGLCMSALPHQGLAFFYGDGANGKSVLVDLVRRVLGDYATSIRIESLTGSNRRQGAEATPDLIPLVGARAVMTSEPDEGQRLQEGMIKVLTGGEPVPVRPNYGEFINVLPFFKLTMSGNHKPEIRGTDDGIWRRVLLVPFDVRIPDERKDLKLGEKLWAERDGVLAWMFEGLLAYLEDGLRPPETVLEATREYREDSDPIGQFLAACFAVTGDPADRVTSKDMVEAFRLYMLERGMTAWKDTTFSRQLSTRARSYRDPATGRSFDKGKSSVAQYHGLRMAQPFASRFRDAPRDRDGRVTVPAAAASAGSPDPSFED
ncbi:phage/plasmid primase, P4 family [Pikeienuella sp. HZG-20]|uniref:DNA primase family protein n=1 Tax=Paludibacillus litoralis TaxID=3133267 RepID=UPI0030EC9BB4